MGRDVLGKFEYQVLGAVLSGHGSAYGASVYDLIERRTGHAPSIGAIYTTLERLQEKGMVSSRWGDATAERGGRRKRLYKIEATGVQALRNTEAAFSGLSGSLIPGVA
jgi:PadR family transcriptional regulator, regulatory protein PadR